jgi:hypothetical protein
VFVPFRPNEGRPHGKTVGVSVGSREIIYCFNNDCQSLLIFVLVMPDEEKSVDAV